VGIRVVLTRLIDHPVDSRAGSFEQATVRAMAEAFAAAGVPEACSPGTGRARFPTPLSSDP
jgi:hypothetical protein